VRGFDKNGLSLYHCIRGTNSVEGAIHNPIRRSFASFNASIELADSLIADFRHRHNLNVGEKNKTGSIYLGHYDPWLDFEIHTLRGDICWISKPVTGAIFTSTDPLKFCPTHEQFGITKIPGALRLQYDFNGPDLTDHFTASYGSHLNLLSIYPIQLHFSRLKGKRKDVYSYLAAAQHVRFAVTPVHTKNEKQLFHQVISIGGEWSCSKGLPKFDQMAAWWSGKADGILIFYKLPEYLATYYKTWLENRQAVHTMVASSAQRKPSERRIRSKGHIAYVLEAAAQNQPAIVADQQIQTASVSEENLDLPIQMTILAPYKNQISKI